MNNGFVDAKDLFNPRILAELARHVTPADEYRPPGKPDDWSAARYISSDASHSRHEKSKPKDLKPPQGKVIWSVHEYLHLLDLDTLRKNIRRYQKNSHKFLDRPAIRRELLCTLRPPGVASTPLPFRDFEVPSDTPLCRARKISRVEDIQEWKHIWTAPPSFIGAGRVNDIHEPLLYTAFDPLTALYEIRAEPGDLVALSFFRTTRRSFVIDIAEDITVENLGKGDRRKLEMIMKFLITVFSQKVPSNESFRYMAPDLVAKEIFNPYPEIYVGWLYKSLADPRNLPISRNVALRGSTAADLVDYKYTQIARINPDRGVEGEPEPITALQREDPSSDKLVPVPSADW